jgi:hypothetical protein
VAGGTAYGGIYMGVIWSYRPTRAAVNTARGVAVVELFNLYIPTMYPKFQNPQKMQKFINPKSFFFKKMRVYNKIYMYIKRINT